MKGMRFVRTLAVGATLILLPAARAQAAPISCDTVTTLTQLLNAVDGCISQDKIYTGFSYTGAFSADSITATSHFTQVGGTDQHGWTFAAQGGITSSFTLAYTISVLPAFPDTFIFASQDQIQDGTIPFNISVTDNQGTAGTLVTNGSSLASVTAQMTYPFLKSITTSSVVTIGGANTLNSFEQVFFEQTAVPEPGSLLLLGTGLFGLAGATRRRLKR